MNLREFLRGGYQRIDDITVVSNHGRPVFTVHPHVTSQSPPETKPEKRPARGRTTVR